MVQNHKKVVSFDLIGKKLKSRCYLSIYEVVDKQELFAEAEIFTGKEKEYFVSLTGEHRKISYLLGRISVYEALKKIDDKKYKDFQITNGIFGQPILHSEEFEVSITHTRNIGGCVRYSSEMLLGIDIEEINENHCLAMSSIITDSEYCEIKKIIPSETIALTTIWTLKEALGKAIKVGLTLPTDFMAIRPEKYNWQKRCLVSTFESFPQYKAKSFLSEKNVMSIVYPRNTEWCDRDE